MDNTLQQQLLTRFAEASDRDPANLEFGEESAQAVRNALAAVPEPSGPSLAAEQPTAAPGNIFGQSASYVGSSARGELINATGGGGVNAGSIATTFLEGGLGLVPLITGLMGLFGGGSTSPAPLEKYAMPSSIAFTSADGGAGMTAADFDQMGAPRMYSAIAPSPATSAPSTAQTNGAGGTVPGGSGSQMATPITVNVQTMDARSFLDNSDQIAQAVRGAMLNLNSINDVISELS